MRTSYITLITLLSAFSSLAQSDKPAERIDIHGFGKELELQKFLEPTDIQGEIWQAQAMSTDGEHIFIVSDKEASPIKAYRLSDGKYMGGVGSIGGGPGEFLSINRSGFGVRKNQLLIQGRRYIRIYNLTADEDKLDFELDKEFKIPGELGILNRAFLLNDNELAAKVMSSPKEFITFRLNEGEAGETTMQRDFGDYPSLYPEIPDKAYHHLYQGGTGYSWDGKYLSKIYSSFPRIRVFDLKDGAYTDIDLKPENEQISKIVPHQRGTSIANGIEMLNYQRNVEMSSDLVVSDYQESTLKKVAMTNRGNIELIPLSDRFLLVFTREGELLVKLLPPDWFRSFVLTPDNKMIVFHPEIEDQLFMVDLNQFR